MPHIKEISRTFFSPFHWIGPWADFVYKLQCLWFCVSVCVPVFLYHYLHSIEIITPPSTLKAAAPSLPKKSLITNINSRLFHVIINLGIIGFYTDSAPWLIQSISCHVLLLSYVVPSWKPRFPVDWRTLVKECSTNIG